MTRKVPQIPGALTLPGGYRLAILTLSDPAFNHAAKAWGFSEDVYAFWCELNDGNGRIYLRKSRNYGRRWQDFSHEMDHALNEWRHWVDEVIADPFFAALKENALEDRGE